MPAKALIETFTRIILAGIIMLTSLPGLASQRSDIVVLVNGNAVTGEVKSLEFGTLKYATDSMGTVSIDWEDVTSITSNQYLEVEIASGRRFYGNLELTEAANTISVGFGDDVDVINMLQVVRVTPIATNERFVDRLEGSVTFGFNTAKASDLTQSRLTADVRYRRQTYLLGLQIDSSVTDQREIETTQRQSVSVNYQRFRRNRWFTDWVISGEKNDELGINSRFLAGGSLGRYLTQTNKNQFSVAAGLVATRESFTGSESSTTNAEGKISFRYLHRSLVPESSIIFTTTIFPRLDDLTSYRAESNLTFRREIVNDLFIDLSIYYSFLSDPVGGAAQDDYSVVTSLGYKF